MNNQPSEQKVYCFLDTDALLNFKTFDEVDWPGILEGNEVCLVLAPTVMKELNKHKDDASNEWRHKRARMLTAKFKKLFLLADAQGIIRIHKDIFLMRIVNEPLIGGDWAALGLDHQENDDRTVATMLEWRKQHPDATIYFVSNDFFALEKARSRQIQPIDIADHVARIERPTPETAQRQALEREIQQLRNRLPQLEIGFDVDGSPVNRIECLAGVVQKAGPAPSDHDIAAQVEQARQRLTQVLGPYAKQKPAKETSSLSPDESRESPKPDVVPQEATEATRSAVDKKGSTPNKRSGVTIAELQKHFEVSNHLKDLIPPPSFITDTLNTLNRATLLTAFEAVPDEHDIAKFTEDWETYLTQLERGLRRQRTEDFGQRCAISLVLCNMGSIEAVNIELRLQFPSGSLVMRADDPHEPLSDQWIPPEPTPHWKRSPALMGLYSVTPGPSGPLPISPTLTITTKTHESVKGTHPKLRPQGIWRLPTFRLHLPPSLTGGFKITYRIEADGMPKPSTGDLAVVLRRGGDMETRRDSSLRSQ